MLSTFTLCFVLTAYKKYQLQMPICKLEVQHMYLEIYAFK